MATTRFRVKLYELTKDYSWDDKGCGQLECCRLEEHSLRIKLQVHSEADESSCLLDSEVLEDTDYHKQQDTLILWSEPDGRDIAISFQEKAGCDDVWAKLRFFQNKPLMDPESDDVLDSEVEQDDLDEDIALLPECTLENLPDIAEILSNSTLALQERLSTIIVTKDYVPELVNLFRTCEELDAIDKLHDLCAVFKSLLNLNESAVCDALFRPECIMDLIGALEYDAEYPERIRHRDYLESCTVFKEVIPFNDQEIVDKIKVTHRLHYLKDVVLASYLDDNTAQIINSFVFFNHNDILRHVTNEDTFLDQLMTRLKAPDLSENDLRDFVMFVRECVGLKNLQSTVRTNCLSALIKHGLFDMFPLSLLHDDERIRNASTEILSAVLSFDAQAVRQHIKVEQRELRTITDVAKRQEAAKRMLLTLIVRRVAMDVDAGLKTEMSEILRTLLDTDTMESFTAPEKSLFLSVFYDEAFDILIQPITSLSQEPNERQRQVQERSSILYTVVELLTSFVTRHGNRIRNRLLRENLVLKIAQLANSSHVYLALAAVRFLRAIVLLNDEFYNRRLIEERVFEPIVRSFLRNGDRYNMFNSTVVNLFRVIIRENLDMTNIIDHIVELYGPDLSQVEYVNTFRELLAVHHQMHSDHPMLTTDANGAEPDNMSVMDMEAAMELERVPTPPAQTQAQEDEFGDGTKKVRVS